MKIFYFGELIEVDGKKVKTENEVKAEELQMQLRFDTASPKPEKQKTGMPSIGELLSDIDLNLDVYRPLRLQRQA